LTNAINKGATAPPRAESSSDAPSGKRHHLMPLLPPND
jgi:hypothetical protein